MVITITIFSTFKSPVLCLFIIFIPWVLTQTNFNNGKNAYNNITSLLSRSNKKYFIKKKIPVTHSAVARKAYYSQKKSSDENIQSVVKSGKNSSKSAFRDNVSSPPPHDTFSFSPAHPFCENCFEHGVFNPRFRGGLQLFESTGDDIPASNSELYRGSKSSLQKPQWCKDVVIVQGDTRPPSASATANNLLSTDYDYTSFVDIMGNGAQTVIDATFLINSAYAYLHDYGYVFFVFDIPAINYRGIEWGNVAILRHVAKLCPSAMVLYLDSDAYIRNLASKIAVSKIKSYRHKNVVQLGKLVEPTYTGTARPTPFLIAAPIECQWMTWLNAQPQLNRCFNMQQHNTLFRTMDWRGDAHAGWSFLECPIAAIIFVITLWAYRIRRGSEYGRDDDPEHRPGATVLGEVVELAGATAGRSYQTLPHTLARGAANIGAYVFLRLTCHTTWYSADMIFCSHHAVTGAAARAGAATARRRLDAGPVHVQRAARSLHSPPLRQSQ